MKTVSLLTKTDILNRVSAIKKNWNANERAARSVEADARQHRLAEILGLEIIDQPRLKLAHAN